MRGENKMKGRDMEFFFFSEEDLDDFHIIGFRQRTNVA
jgi:hypothetical protein